MAEHVSAKASHFKTTMASYGSYRRLSLSNVWKTCSGKEAQAWYAGRFRTKNTCLAFSYDFVVVFDLDWNEFSAERLLLHSPCPLHLPSFSIRLLRNSTSSHLHRHTFQDTVCLRESFLPLHFNLWISCLLWQFPRTSSISIFATRKGPGKSLPGCWNMEAVSIKTLSPWLSGILLVFPRRCVPGIFPCQRQFISFFEKRYRLEVSLAGFSGTNWTQTLQMWIQSIMSSLPQGEFYINSENLHFFWSLSSLSKIYNELCECCNQPPNKCKNALVSCNPHSHRSSVSNRYALLKEDSGRAQSAVHESIATCDECTQSESICKSEKKFPRLADDGLGDSFELSSELNVRRHLRCLSMYANHGLF